MTFKDHFSNQSKCYQQFRPSYPKALFSYLNSLTQHHDKAWDCATGNGQVAVTLSESFNTVIATDASANQIQNAITRQGVDYQVCLSENTPIKTQSIDLITVAQALHWFDIKAFSQEATRVMKHQSIMAVWMYNLLSISPEIDDIIKFIYHNELNQYWAKERIMVEKNYRNVDFALPSVNKVPEFSMSALWGFEDLIGYLKTWSAVKNQEKITDINIIEQYRSRLYQSWGVGNCRRIVTWPLVLKIWRKS